MQHSDKLEKIFLQYKGRGLIVTSEEEIIDYIHVSKIVMQIQ